MTAEDDRRRLDGFTAAIAALQAGERHSAEDRELIRKEIRDSRRELGKDIAEVGGECAAFRKEVRDAWKQDREEREKKAKEDAERKDKDTTSRRLFAGAVLAASATVLAAIIAATAAILTGGPS